MWWTVTSVSIALTGRLENVKWTVLPTAIAKNSSTRRSKSLTCILLHLVANKERESKDKRYELDFKVCLCAMHDPGKAQHFRAEEAWSADQTTLWLLSPLDLYISCPAESTYLLNMIEHLQAIKGKISVVTLEPRHVKHPYREQCPSLRFTITFPSAVICTRTGTPQQVQTHFPVISPF